MINFSDPVVAQVAVLSIGGVFFTAIVYRFAFGMGRISRLLVGIVKLLAMDLRVRRPELSDKIKAIEEVAVNED